MTTPESKTDSTGHPPVSSSEFVRRRMLWSQVMSLEYENKVLKESLAWYQKHAHLSMQLLWHCRKKHGETVTVGEDERQYAEVGACRCELCVPPNNASTTPVRIA